MMIGTANALCRLDHLTQREVGALGRLKPEATPGGGTVAGNRAIGGLGFEQLEGALETPPKLRAINRTELRFRIMQIVDIDGFEAEIGAAQSDHRGEPFRRHAM